MSLTFVPFSVVAVNPQSLPPGALVQFNPLPDVNNLPAASASFQNPILLQGSFQQTIKPSPATNTSVAGHLTINYSLQGSVSGSVTPPTATQAGTFTATFNVTGRVTEVLFVPGSTLQFPWAISTTITEHGTVSGALNAPQAAATVTDPMTFSAVIGLNQTEYSVSPLGIPTVPWFIQANVQAAGNFQVAVPPPSSAIVPDRVAAAFAVQDQINESLSTPSANLLPPITISGVDNASGTVAETVYSANAIGGSSGPTIMPLEVYGTTQYHEQLAETITRPTGGTQTLSEAFDTTGLFQYGELILTPVVSPDASPMDTAS